MNQSVTKINSFDDTNTESVQFMVMIILEPKTD